MLISISTDKSLSETGKALETAITANKFGVLHVHNLKETMTDKGVELEHECLIFEVCNPHSAKLVLDADMGISTALPCRISVYEEGGKTFLATLRPTMMLSMFQVPDLASMAQEVEDTIVKIMNEAVRED